MTITLALASPLSGSLYRREMLNAEDMRRAAQFPGKHCNADWRSSRVLKSLFLPDREPASPYSLSHTYGYAALAYTAHPFAPVSIDLELIQKRNFHRLLDLVATEEEMVWWQEQGRTAEAFYRLWTLKEALVKTPAAGSLPTLNTVGLYWAKDNVWFAGIRGKERYSARWYVLDNACMLCIVWPGNGEAAVCPHFYGFDKPILFAEQGRLSNSVSK